MMLVRIPAVAPDEDLLVRLSERNPGFKIERDSSGEITMAPPNGGFGGAKSGQAVHQLINYAVVHGGKGFDSSQGWAIGPNDAVRSPDASWLSQAQVDAVPEKARRSGTRLQIAPAVAIEVKSPSDDWAMLIEKAAEYHRRGSVFAVAVNPETREVVSCGMPPPGLELDFDAIFDA